MAVSSEILIAEYLAAYKAANGCDYHEKITYENGWFVFSGPYRTRIRRKELGEMRDRLLARTAKRAAERETNNV